MLLLCHIIYFVAGLFICWHDLKAVLPGSNGILRRTNMVISTVLLIYSIVQIGLTFAWVGTVNDVKVDDTPMFPDTGVMDNPQKGFWFSLSAIFCQLWGSLIRFLLTFLITNKSK